MIISLRNSLCAERIGLYDVGPSFKVFAMYVNYEIWPRKRKQVVVPFQLSGNVAKTFPAIILFSKAEALEHGSHSSVENEDTLAYDVR